MVLGPFIRNKISRDDNNNKEANHLYVPSRLTQVLRKTGSYKSGVKNRRTDVRLYAKIAYRTPKIAYRTPKIAYRTPKLLIVRMCLR